MQFKTIYSLSATLITGVVALLLFQACDHQKKSSETDDEQAVIEFVASGMEYYKTKTGALWPGYLASLDPLILTFDNGHIYAFNYASAHPIWDKQSIAGQPILYTTNDLWGLKQVQVQSEFPIEDKKVLVSHFDVDHDDPYRPYLRILHHKFVEFERNHFPYISKHCGAYLDHFNVENVALMQIEEMILSDFINAFKDKEMSDFHKALYLRDYVAINQMRVQLLQESSLKWELKRQKTDGLAEYVALKSIELFPSVKDFRGIDRLLDVLQDPTVNEEVMERTINWRHDGVGAALSYGLELLNIPDWKKILTQTDRTQIDLIREELALSQEEVEARVEKIYDKYGYDLTKEYVESALKQYMEEITDLYKEYSKMPGVEVHIKKPDNVLSVDTGSALYKYYLADGTILSLADTSTYTLGKDWKLELVGIPLVMKNPTEKELVAKLDSKDIVNVDGTKYTLAKFVANAEELDFTSISLKSRHVMFESKDRPGKIFVNNGRLYVTFNKL